MLTNGGWGQDSFVELVLGNFILYRMQQSGDLIFFIITIIIIMLIIMIDRNWSVLTVHLVKLKRISLCVCQDILIVIILTSEKPHCLR